jgi:mannosyltransferase
MPSYLSLLQRHASKWVILPVIAILLLATATRFHQLGTQSLWHDEGNSFVQTTRSLSQIAEHTARDIHPPGYYWLLMIWTKFAGTTEFAMRALSAFAAIISIAFTYALGKQLFSKSSGLAAAAFVALNTFNIYYSQEARMYALLTMWAVASMWTFLIFMKYVGSKHASPNIIPSIPHHKNPIVRWGIILAIFNAAGLYTQYAFPFVILTQGVLFILWVIAVGTQRAASNVASIIYYIAVNLLTIILYLPWIFTAWEQITTWPNTGQSTPATEAIAEILARFSFGVTAASGTTITVIFFLLFGLLVLPKSKKDSWWLMITPVFWVLITVGMFLAMDLFREANLKLLLPAQIGFALWMGRGVWILWHIKPRRKDSPIFRAAPKLAAVLGSLMLLIEMWTGVTPLYDNITYQRDDYRGIVTTITAAARPGDAIILDAPNQQEVFNYYYDGDTPVFLLPRGLGGDDEATLQETRQIINTYDRIFAVFWSTSERDPNNVVENTLDSETYEIDDNWYGKPRLVRYVTPTEFTTFNESGVQFGDSIILERFAINTERVHPADVVQIRLEWSSTDELTTRYKVFIQLLDYDGFLMEQRDSEPGGGLSPTTSWQSGETIIDNHALIIPSDLPPANYSLIIGLYDINDPQLRLSTITDNENSSFLLLTTIEVSE